MRRRFRGHDENAVCRNGQGSQQEELEQQKKELAARQEESERMKRASDSRCCI